MPGASGKNMSLLDTFSTMTKTGTTAARYMFVNVGGVENLRKLTAQEENEYAIELHIEGNLDVEDIVHKQSHGHGQHNSSQRKQSKPGIIAPALLSATSLRRGSLSMSKKVLPVVIADAAGDDDEDGTISLFTTERREVSNSACIWNQTFILEIPDPVPSALRLELFATYVVRLTGEDGGAGKASIAAPIHIGSSRVLLGEPLISSGWNEDLRFSPIERLSFKDIEKKVKDDPTFEAADDPTASLTSSSSKGFPPTANGEVSKRSRSSMRNTIIRTGSTVLVGKKKKASIAEILFGAVPDGAQLGVSVLREAKNVGVIEAMWDGRRLNRNHILMMQRPWFIASPNHPLAKRWHRLLGASMLYVSLVVPYDVSVMVSDQPILRLATMFILVIFGADLVFQFFVGYFDRALNQFIFDPKMIAGTYIGTWFWVDVVALVPIISIFFGYSPIVQLLLLVKLFRLPRVLGVGKKGPGSQYFVLLQFSCTLLYLLHWVACSYCLLAQVQREYFDGHPTWQDNDSLQISGALSKYLHGLEFAMFAMVLTCECMCSVRS